MFCTTRTHTLPIDGRDLKQVLRDRDTVRRTELFFFSLPPQICSRFLRRPRSSPGTRFLRLLLRVCARIVSRSFSLNITIIIISAHSTNSSVCLVIACPGMGQSIYGKLVLRVFLAFAPLQDQLGLFEMLATATHLTWGFVAIQLLRSFERVITLGKSSERSRRDHCSIGLLLSKVVHTEH